MNERQSFIVRNFNRLLGLASASLLAVCLSFSFAGQILSSGEHASDTSSPAGEAVDLVAQSDTNQVAETSLAPPSFTVTPRGKRSESIPNVLLLTHEGNEVYFRDDLVKDGKVAINFMYTVCKGICPGMTANIKKVREQLASRGIDDITFISISIEPEQDTPEKLANYMRINEIENRPGIAPWIFLSGELAQIDQVRRALGVYDPDPKVDADRRQHGGILTYGNDRSDWWGATPALQKTELLVDTLVRNLKSDKRFGPHFGQTPVALD